MSRMGVIIIVVATKIPPKIANPIPRAITAPNGTAIRKFEMNEIAGKSPYIALAIGNIARFTAMVVVRCDLHANTPSPPLSPFMAANAALNGGASA